MLSQAKVGVLSSQSLRGPTFDRRHGFLSTSKLEHPCEIRTKVFALVSSLPAAYSGGVLGQRLILELFFDSSSETPVGEHYPSDETSCFTYKSRN